LKSTELQIGDNVRDALVDEQGEIDLSKLLSAWNTATTRLQKTHATLREEVRRLTDELEIKNRELARKNRLADLGQMASHIAHEVRNGLMPVTLYLSLLRRRVTGDAGCLDIMDKIESGFTALDSTVNDLLHFTSDRIPRWQCFPLADLVNEVRESMAPQIMAQGISVETDIAPSVMLTADREMTRRAVLNLMLNSIDAMPDGGPMVLTCWEEPGLTELEIADEGPGFSDNDIRKMFEPFYTTKNTGTGLGLAIVYRIMDVHGGSVLAQNCPEGGAAVTLRFTRRAMEVAA